jgi:hypothetical protein
MIDHELRKAEGGDPVLTITVTGTHDIFRLAHHMERGQCEFARAGQRIKEKLRRRIGLHNYGALVDYMLGRGPR